MKAAGKTTKIGRSGYRDVTATPLFICGTFGAALATWLIGYLSDRAGNLRAGMFVLIVSIVLLIALQTALSLRTPSEHDK